MLPPAIQSELYSIAKRKKKKNTLTALSTDEISKRDTKFANFTSSNPPIRWIRLSFDRAEVLAHFPETALGLSQKLKSSNRIGGECTEFGFSQGRLKSS
ncbi:hypothetical protein PQX77_006963 [Marasmius sp. AFHP31]|nr:hypothetical protein PQX77_006963 [Marasmius sp. AFHP31]